MGRKADATDEPDNANRSLCASVSSCIGPRLPIANEAAGRCSREFAFLIPIVFIGPRPPTTAGQATDAADETEDAPRSSHACIASSSSTQGLQPKNDKRPMPPISPRIPPRASRYGLANLNSWVFADQNAFETQEGMQPMSPNMPPESSNTPTAHRRQHVQKTLGR